MRSISFWIASFVEARKGQAKEEADSAVENHESLAEGALDLLGRAFDRGGIGNAPVRGHGLAGPDGTHFLRGVVANGEDEIHLAARRASQTRPSSCCATRQWADGPSQVA